MMDRNNKIAHLLKWGTLLLAVLLSPCTSLGQCGDIETLNYSEPPCGNGLFTGQSIELESNGYLQSVTLSVCTGTESQLVIRAHQGEGSDWNTGAILGNANESYPASGSTADCLPSQNGFAHYISRTFTFTDVALEGGIPYVLHLTSGVAATGCTVSYPGGMAFKNNGDPGEDLVFALEFCPAEGLTFGCTNSEACNFDPTASVDNGSCQTLDCAGTCGGEATLDPCGVCNGDGTTCLGCTDSTACNYDELAITDDGSCLIADCNGDCGGDAFIASCGTCIHGLTGLDETACHVCPDQETQGTLESPCGLGLLHGQSFEVESTGYLYSVTLSVCATEESRLSIRMHNGTANGWAEGQLVSQSQAVSATASTLSECLPSVHGFNHYALRTFEFSGTALSASSSYVMALESAVASSGCSTPYAHGTAFSSSGALSNEDLIFEVIHCPEETIAFGCTDPDACNFDPTATGEDGSCLEEDCNGDCGGTAYLDPDCGCLESPAEAGSCLGCLDANACNFDSLATVSDGSCLFLDCHGDCGGTAVQSDCGCIGGNTGYAEIHCIDGCLTESLATSDSPCPPGLLRGQSFTAETSGMLKAIRLKTCCSVDAQLAVRRHVEWNDCGDNAAWNSGELMATSNIIPSTCQGLSSCLTSNGTHNYLWNTFSFDDVPLKSGEKYTLELLAGYAISSCEGNYDGGTAYGSTAPINDDLIMDIMTCTDMVWGCMDPTACSGYDPAATFDDGSCEYLDCHGDCGGSAENTPCGCIGGLTGIMKEQCLDGNIGAFIGSNGATCTPLLFGQEFLAPEDGFLAYCGLHVDPSEAQVVRLERTDGPLSGLNLGEVSHAAQEVPCLEAGNRNWTEFSFEDEIPLEGGMHYRLIFLEGSGSSSCVPDYPDGAGLNELLDPTFKDMAFELVYREPVPDELIWGCTDPTFCNYDANATHDNGTCATEDCHGDCAGSAVVIDGCGCVGGNTGINPATCYGCTDPSACNYVLSAVIDDGSCAFDVDCHGDCGGTATMTAECGCVGGNTDYPSASCLDLCLGYPAISSWNADIQVQGLGFSDGGQTFEAPSNEFLTSTRIKVFNEPTSAMTVELRSLDGSQPGNGTLLLSQALSSWDSTANGYDVHVEWALPELLSQGESYALVLTGGGWQYPQGSGLGITGSAFSSFGGASPNLDLFIELITCTDLYGCTSPLACNFDDWATQDNGSCTYPDAGLQCDGTPCGADQDGDGICASADLDDTDPLVCFDGDGDGCDDCSSGTYAPEADGPDTDGDGLCDSGDLCSNPEADNFDDPANGPCEGQCDNAPLFHGIQVDVPATDPWSENGTFTFSSDEAGFPFANSLLFEATTLSLTGMNGAPDYVFDLSGTGLASANMTVQPGWYAATLLNSSGCPGVATAVHGSTFGQTPVALPLIMTYSLCCGDCGNSDVDNDMICDSEDECIDREALNYADPANGPCQY